jgi:DNA topoisomerase VI subunit B
MPSDTLTAEPADLIKAETALRSFRDGGYILADAVGEMVDNCLQSGADKIRLDWEVTEIPIGKGRSQKTKRQLDWFAVADNGTGITADLVANVLTVGFSTRYGSRDGIGRFGVGFKLASISQAKRIEIYTRPAFLKATKNRAADGRETWTYSEPNEEGRIFRTYLDLEEIEAHVAK